MAIYNINLLGDGGVGKTTWIHKIKTGEFTMRYFATIGSVVHPIDVNTNYGNIELNLFDYAGQEKYSGRTYYKSDASIIMFDLTSKVSYKNISFWQKECGTEPVIIVGNKCDIQEIKVVPDIPYLALSAKRMSTIDFFTPILRRLTGHDDLVILQ